MPTGIIFSPATGRMTLSDRGVNGNGRNGVLLKIIVGVLTVGLVSAGGGMMKLYRDVGVLQQGSGIERRIDRLEELTRDIATDRDKRTIILQGIRSDIEALRRDVEDLRHRLDRRP